MGSGALAQLLEEATTAQLQPVLHSLSLVQFTVGAWQRNSFEGSQVQLVSGGRGTGVPPSLASLPPPALPEQAHCSPEDAH